MKRMPLAREFLKDLRASQEQLTVARDDGEIRAIMLEAADKAERWAREVREEAERQLAELRGETL